MRNHERWICIYKQVADGTNERRYFSRLLNIEKKNCSKAQGVDISRIPLPGQCKKACFERERITKPRREPSPIALRESPLGTLECRDGIVERAEAVGDVLGGPFLVLGTRDAFELPELLQQRPGLLDGGVVDQPVFVLAQRIRVGYLMVHARAVSARAYSSTVRGIKGSGDAPAGRRYQTSPSARSTFSPSTFRISSSL
jgi:hypothetical protein